MNNTATIESNRIRKLSIIGSISSVLLWGYFSAIFLLYNDGLPIRFGSLIWFATCITLGVLAFQFSKHLLEKYQSKIHVYQNATLLILVTIISLVALDITFSIYLNHTANQPNNAANNSKDLYHSRITDKHIWIGELYPKFYYPTKKNFRIHKPGITVTGPHFGGAYESVMLKSPTLVNSVLDLREETIAINSYGFREKSSFDEARIFALGDSFTFGWSVNDELAWPSLLEKSIGKSVYNLGIHDSSPKQELELLKYVLQTYKGSVHIENLLWMIYEGNDLEDSYDEYRPLPSTGNKNKSLTSGTILNYIADFPNTLKRQSVINRFLTGTVFLRLPDSISKQNNPGLVDGIQISHDFYRSPTLGGGLFLREYIERSQKPRQYVYNHPNRSKLEKVFQEMATLAKEEGFEVTVLMVPTSIRLHGRYFTDFPAISSKPYFLDFVQELSETQGFRNINLFSLMEPYASQNLLFFRDDDHLNEAGHALVAELLRNQLFANQTK